MRKESFFYDFNQDLGKMANLVGPFHRISDAINLLFGCQDMQDSEDFEDLTNQSTRRRIQRLLGPCTLGSRHSMFLTHQKEHHGVPMKLMPHFKSTSSSMASHSVKQDLLVSKAGV